jgi:hypothetical protein
MLLFRLLPLILIIALIAVIVMLARTSQSSPEERLRLHFGRARRTILGQLAASPYLDEAGQILAQCEAYLERLCATRRQKQEIEAFARAASEITTLDEDVAARINRIETMLGERLSQLIHQLAVLSSPTLLDVDGTMHALRELSEDMRRHEAALRELEGDAPDMDVGGETR